MKLPPEERAAINRQNASRSTGPKSPGGKRRASRNSYKNGMNVKLVDSLPPEDQAVYDALNKVWLDYYQPDTPHGVEMIHRAVFASVQFRRNARAQAALISEQVNNAVVEWETEQLRRLGELKELFPEDPAAAVLELRCTALGCRWLLDQWRGLAEVLDRYTYFHAEEHRDRLIRLLGLDPTDMTHEEVYWIHILNITVHRNPLRSTLDWLLDARNVPRPLALVLHDAGPPDGATALAQLKMLIAEQVAELAKREEHLRLTIEEPARAGARDRALLLGGEAGALWLRYERMHDSSFHRALKGLASPPPPIGSGEALSMSMLGEGRPAEAGPAVADDPASAGETIDEVGPASAGPGSFQNTENILIFDDEMAFCSGGPDRTARATREACPAEAGPIPVERCLHACESEIHVGPTSVGPDPSETDPIIDEQADPAPAPLGIISPVQALLAHRLAEAGVGPEDLRDASDLHAEERGEPDPAPAWEVPTYPELCSEPDDATPESAEAEPATGPRRDRRKRRPDRRREQRARRTARARAEAKRRQASKPQPASKPESPEEITPGLVAIGGRRNLVGLRRAPGARRARRACPGGTAASSGARALRPSHPASARNEANLTARNEANLTARNEANAPPPRSGIPLESWWIYGTAETFGETLEESWRDESNRAQNAARRKLAEQRNEAKSEPPPEPRNETKPEPPPPPEPAQELPKMIGTVVVRPPRTDRSLIDAILEHCSDDNGRGKGKSKGRGEED